MLILYVYWHASESIYTRSKTNSTLKLTVVLSHVSPHTCMFNHEPMHKVLQHQAHFLMLVEVIVFHLELQPPSRYRRPYECTPTILLWWLNFDVCARSPEEIFLLCTTTWFSCLMIVVCLHIRPCWRTRCTRLRLKPCYIIWIYHNIITHIS